jgi:IclR family acetate operon transcriptional repressor
MQTDTSPGGGRPAYPIYSVDSALRLLKLFRESDSVRLTDACAYLGVAHSTAHRLLSMLIQHGFVRQDARTRAYLPGPTLIEIGLAAIQRMDIRKQARPLLEDLADRVRETVHLVTLEGNQARFLDAVEGTRALRVAPRAGTMLPAHCTSAGKVLLADLSTGELRRLYPEGVPFETQTSHSLSSLSELTRVLDDVREAGYACNDEESEEGVGSVASAIRTATGEAVAAVAVAIPLSRLNEQVRAEVLKTLQDALAKYRPIITYIR